MKGGTCNTCPSARHTADALCVLAVLACPPAYPPSPPYPSHPSLQVGSDYMDAKSRERYGEEGQAPENAAPTVRPVVGCTGRKGGVDCVWVRGMLTRRPELGELTGHPGPATFANLEAPSHRALRMELPC